MLRNPRGRRAFTLTEMLFVLVIFGLVASVTMRIIVRQQRFFTSTADLAELRTSLRDVVGAVPTDLRAISSVGGDIYAMSDSSIDFRMSTGLSVVCAIPSASTIIIPPPSLTSRSAVTSWLTPPVSGDTAFVYDEGAGPTTSDDSWLKIRLTAAPIVGTCPTSTGYTGTAAEAASGYTLTVAPALPSTVVVGSVIRFYRRAKYKLFQPTANGSWYVGYMECPGGVCGTLQAVAGPYAAYSNTASVTGLRFVYRDSTGAITNTPTSVARIDITVRSQTRNVVRMPGRPIDYFRDSLVVSVALRNRS